VELEATTNDRREPARIDQIEILIAPSRFIRPRSSFIRPPVGMEDAYERRIG
jgi:hypothetical protein